MQITNLTGADPNVDLEGLYNTGGALVTKANFLSSRPVGGRGDA